MTGIEVSIKMDVERDDPIIATIQNAMSNQTPLPVVFGGKTLDVVPHSFEVQQSGVFSLTFVDATPAPIPLEISFSARGWVRR